MTGKSFAESLLAPPRLEALAGLPGRSPASGVSLGQGASFVTPPHRGVEKLALSGGRLLMADLEQLRTDERIAREAELAGDPERPLRTRMVKLRRAAAELRPVDHARVDESGANVPSRICLCGWASVDHGHPSITVRTSQGRASAGVVGVQTCGSVWECAECAGVITRERAREVQHVVNHAHGLGRVVHLVSLTVRHTYGDELRTMRRNLADAWRGVQRGAPWERQKKRHGLAYVRRLESTVGEAHGWHPHLHLLILADGELPAEFLAWLDARWCTMVERYMGAEHVGELPHRFDCQRVRAAESASRYLSKLGLELTDAFTVKRARNGNFTPWGLLAEVDASAHRETPAAEWAAERWREWVSSMRGAKQLTWSRGLRELAGLGDETADEIIAEREALDGDPRVVIPRDHARELLARPHIRLPLLRGVELGLELAELVAIVQGRASFEAALAFELVNDANGEHLERVRRDLAERRAALARGLVPERRQPMPEDRWFERALAGNARGELVRAARAEVRERKRAALLERIADWQSLGRVVDSEFADF